MGIGTQVSMFIAFEGIDGTGKTTLVHMVREALENKGHRVYATKEPTDSLTLPDKIKKSRSAASGLSLFFRFTEDRFAHQREIADHLSTGEIVLCDRYLMSSMAYQGVLLESFFGNREKTIEWMMSVSGIIVTRPDITFYIDVEPEISMKRVKSRGALTGFEEKEYLEKVRAFYTAIDMPGKITLNGAGTLSDSFRDVMGHLSEKLRQ